MVFQINDIVVHKETGKHYKVIGKHYHLLLCRSIDNPNVERPIGRHKVDLVPNQILSCIQLAEKLLSMGDENLSRSNAKDLIDEIYDKSIIN